MGGLEATRTSKRKYGGGCCDQGCVVFSDWEEPGLPVWDGASKRRRGELQHIRDVPRTLTELMQWLGSVSDFEVESGLVCPNIVPVWDLAEPSWEGMWTPEALLSFIAAANASGVMHPPLDVRVLENSDANRSLVEPSVGDADVQGGIQSFGILSDSDPPSDGLYLVPNLVPLIVLSDSSLNSASSDSDSKIELDHTAESISVKDDTSSPCMEEDVTITDTPGQLCHAALF